MNYERSARLNDIRSVASAIFSYQFTQECFESGYDRGAKAEFQELLEAEVTASGSKKYKLLPLILFPSSPKSKKSVFLNPALIKVSIFSSCRRSLVR